MPTLDPTGAAADLVLAEEAAALARRAAAVALPPPLLDGWESLCAAEYAQAAQALRTRVALAIEALRSAAAMP